MCGQPPRAGHTNSDSENTQPEAIISDEQRRKPYEILGSAKYYLKIMPIRAVARGAASWCSGGSYDHAHDVDRDHEEGRTHLIRERNGIATAKWNAVTYHSAVYYGSTPTPKEADEQLQWAIEEFRKRKLDAIDVQLRELGVDPTEQESAA